MIVVDVLLCQCSCSTIIIQLRHDCSAITILLRYTPDASPTRAAAWETESAAWRTGTGLYEYRGSAVTQRPNYSTTSEFAAREGSGTCIAFQRSTTCPRFPRACRVATILLSAKVKRIDLALTL